ncbi:N-acetyltransferase 9-like protein isoform X2 [Anabrus simplex]|uniref:N-acetyltransferase 9-like protein isoform X2 n=1 Tax=Anabrus simplex TaxID=316456 RepID=UPI0035A2BC45
MYQILRDIRREREEQKEETNMEIKGQRRFPLLCTLRLQIDWLYLHQFQLLYSVFSASNKFISVSQPHQESRYHDWMKNEELQKLTASEPLTLEEEFSMRDSWELDEDKCTFIILDKVTLNETGDEVSAMIGDTNLFMLPDEDSLNTAEAEIMIAEMSARRKRRGWEAMLLMLRYGCQQLGIEKYCAKIGFDNKKSLSMFTKMGFHECRDCPRTCSAHLAQIFLFDTMGKPACLDVG